MRQAGRRGQGTVEFALVCVIMFSVFSGIIELSWWFYNLIYLNNAANKAVRMYAKSGGTAVAAQDVLVNERGGLQIATWTFKIMNSNFVETGVKTRGGYIQIDARINYNSLSPFKSFIYMANMSTIRTQAMMRIEAP